MTFPLQFDLLMVGVCTFIQNKKQKKTKKKSEKKNKKKKKKKQKKKKKKKECKDMFVSHILLHQFFVVGFIVGGLSEIFMRDDDFFVVGFIVGGLSEIFMRDELRESSLRSFVPWILDDTYWI